ncbi:MAG: Arm DNA-binding domain-containing protein [Chitinophagaceae bacterium]
MAIAAPKSELSIYLRVTINGERFEVSTQRYIEPPKWSISAGKVIGNSEEAGSIINIWMA